MIKIKRITNGWVVLYQTYKLDMRNPYVLVVDGEREKAFTYDFEEEKTKAWSDLMEFIKGHIAYDLSLQDSK